MLQPELTDHVGDGVFHCINATATNGVRRLMERQCMGKTEPNKPEGLVCFLLARKAGIKP